MHELIQFETNSFEQTVYAHKPSSAGAYGSSVVPASYGSDSTKTYTIDSTSTITNTVTVYPASSAGAGSAGCGSGATVTVTETEVSSSHFLYMRNIPLTLDFRPSLLRLVDTDLEATQAQAPTTTHRGLFQPPHLPLPGSDQLASALSTDLQAQATLRPSLRHLATLSAGLPASLRTVSPLRLISATTLP